MNNINLQFTANEQELVNNAGRIMFASDAVAYVTASFTLGTNWNGFDSVRAIWKSKSHVIGAVLDHDGNCIVPQEVLTEKGEVFVNLVGSIVDGGLLTDRLTTFAISALSVVQKVRIEGDAGAQVTPSMFEEFVAIVHADADRAEIAADNAADDVVDQLEQYVTAASASEQNAASSASAAAASASDASYQRAESLSAKTAAEQAASDAAASAQQAANVFQLAGDTSFSVDPITKKVTMHVTVSE